MARTKPEADPRTTRERLLAAALEVLREEGWASLSTVRLAQTVGIVQSGFYRHFPSVEACVGEAIAPIAVDIRGDIAARRRAWFSEDVDDFTRAIRHYQENLAIVVERPTLAEILLKRRFERSPVGALMSAFSEGLVADIVEDMTSARLRRGLATDAERARLAGHMILAAVFGAIELLLERRAHVELAGEALARLGAALGDDAWLSGAPPKVSPPPRRKGKSKPKRASAKPKGKPKP